MTEHQNTTFWSDIGECGYKYYVSINYLPLLDQIKKIWFMVFNDTFNDISVILWRSVLLVEKITSH
jgi:hypothetical protein